MHAAESSKLYLRSLSLVTDLGEHEVGDPADGALGELRQGRITEPLEVPVGQADDTEHAMGLPLGSGGSHAPRPDLNHLY